VKDLPDLYQPIRSNIDHRSGTGRHADEKVSVCSRSVPSTATNRRLNGWAATATTSGSKSRAMRWSRSHHDSNVT
jgi:hypothetical protein